jgi:hypothetical protein
VEAHHLGVMTFESNAGVGLPSHPSSQYEDRLIIDIDNDLADFYAEINYRLKFIARADQDTRDNLSIEDWIIKQKLDPLFILNAIPKVAMWYFINKECDYRKVIGFTNCDLDATKKWAETWEIPFDKIMSAKSFEVKLEPSEYDD